MKFSLSRSRLRILSRETGSAVPSRVSPLILRTQAESSIRCLLRAGFLPLSATASTYYTVKRHGASPEFIESHNCVLYRDGVHCRESAGTGPLFAFSGFSMHLFSFFTAPLFPTLTICMCTACTVVVDMRLKKNGYRKHQRR